MKFKKPPLGPYKEAALPLIALMRYDALVWTPGLAFRPGSTWRYRAVISIVSALRLRHLKYLKDELEGEGLNHIEDPRWAARQIGITVGEYLLAPALLPRKTYWRSGISDVPFFMQPWLSLGLLAAALHPPAAVYGGVILSTTTYNAAALANREGSLRDRYLFLRLGNFTVTGVAAGTLVWWVARRLVETQKMAESARQSAVRLAEEEENQQAQQNRRLSLAAFDSVFSEGYRLVAESLDEPNRKTALEDFEEYQAEAAKESPQYKQIADARMVVELASATTGVEVMIGDLDVPSSLLPPEQSHFLGITLDITLANSRKARGATVSVIADICVETCGGILITVRDGGTLPGHDQLFIDGHALQALAKYAEARGGWVRPTPTRDGLAAFLPKRQES